MPFASVDSSTRLYFRLEGLPQNPVLMLSHSLGADHGMWDLQMPEFLKHFRVLRYDTRGHGASDVTPGDYTVERLSRDALALSDYLGIHEFHFCGLSLGGMTGMRIAANHPGRIQKLVLANTSAKFPDPAPMDTRRRTVLESGMPAVADAVMDRFLRKSTRESGNPYAATTLATLLATDPNGYASCCAAVRDLDNRDLLEKIDVPVLIVCSETDQSTPWQGHGDYLAAKIVHAQIEMLDTAHLSNIDEPAAFSNAVIRFLLPAS